MKFVFLAGGFVGFCLAAGTAWSMDHSYGRIFFDATVGCLTGAVLFRFFWQAVLSALRDSFVARHRAAVAELSAKSK